MKVTNPFQDDENIELERKGQATTVRLLLVRYDFDHAVEGHNERDFKRCLNNLKDAKRELNKAIKEVKELMAITEE